ncbi:MAG: Flp pilus assembly protein CpaB [Pseudomonadota bacterium]
MRMVFGLVLILGVALAGGAVYLAQGYISEYRAALAKERAVNIPLTEIIIAKDRLEYGDEITKDDVALVRWPVPAVPEGAFKSREDLFARGDDYLRSVVRTMEKGEPILAVKVTEPGEGVGLTSLLDPGTRAFTIRVDVQTGVSGFLRPGDKVDVYWTGQAPNPDGRGGRDTTMLIENAVEIVAIDQTSKTDLVGANVARTITTQVSPQQVARLAQAQNSGRLSLALVGSRDTTVAQVIDVDQDTLLGVVRQQAAEVQEEQKCSIRTRRGADVVEIPIPCTE